MRGAEEEPLGFIFQMAQGLTPFESLFSRISTQSSHGHSSIEAG